MRRSSSRLRETLTARPQRGEKRSISLSRTGACALIVLLLLLQGSRVSSMLREQLTFVCKLGHLL